MDLLEKGFTSSAWGSPSTIAKTSTDKDDKHSSVSSPSSKDFRSFRARQETNTSGEEDGVQGD